MATIVFERLVGRDVVRLLSAELDLAGIKTSVNTFLAVAIVGWVAITIIVSFALVLAIKLEPALALLAGIAVSVIFELMLYSILELNIEQRKNFMETILPDYLQLTAANVRSGISLSKAMQMGSRAEFKYFNDDIEILSNELYAGETMQNALDHLANRYRSQELRRTVRMMMEAQQFGGGMTDLLNQISKDLRQRQIVQKEISGQLFMYTIFIAFAALVGAPALYGLTNEMIKITSLVWSQISIGSVSSVPSGGVSFLHFSKPQITVGAYQDFSIGAILIITSFAAFITSTISSGSAIKGLKYLPIFVVVGFIVYFIVLSLIGGLFTTFGAGGTSAYGGAP